MSFNMWQKLTAKMTQKVVACGVGALTGRWGMIGEAI